MSFSSLITNAFNIWAISWKWNKYRTWQCSSETINIIFFNRLSMFDEKKCHKIVNSIELDNNIRIFKSDKCNRHYILIFLEHMYDSNFLNVYFCFNTNHYVKTKKIYTIVCFKIHYDIHWYIIFFCNMLIFLKFINSCSHLNMVMQIKNNFVSLLY